MSRLIRELDGEDILVAHRPHPKTHSVIGEMWQEAYTRGGNLSFKIASGSMSPVIEVGDVVKVSRAQLSEIRIGDIVAFKDGQHVVVHRLIGKNWSNAQLILRHMGDAGTSSATIPAHNLIGRVSAIKRNGREIFFSKSSYVMSNRIQVWRLRLVDRLSRIQPPVIDRRLRLVLRPVWRLCRNLLLRRS